MTTDREQRIRELAHRIWESEGRPHGEEQRHWHMAVRLVEASETRGIDPLDAAVEPDSTPTAPAITKKARAPRKPKTSK